MKNPEDHLKWCVHQDHVLGNGSHSIDEITRIYYVVISRPLWAENLQVMVVAQPQVRVTVVVVEEQQVGLEECLDNAGVTGGSPGDLCILPGAD